jgi:hypothetical protein
VPPFAQRVLAYQRREHRSPLPALVRLVSLQAFTRLNLLSAKWVVCLLPTENRLHLKCNETSPPNAAGAKSPAPETCNWSLPPPQAIAVCQYIALMSQTNTFSKHVRQTMRRQLLLPCQPALDHPLCKTKDESVYDGPSTPGEPKAGTSSWCCACYLVKGSCWLCSGFRSKAWRDRQITVLTDVHRRQGRSLNAASAPQAESGDPAFMVDSDILAARRRTCAFSAPLRPGATNCTTYVLRAGAHMHRRS